MRFSLALFSLLVAVFLMGGSLSQNTVKELKIAYECEPETSEHTLNCITKCISGSNKISFNNTYDKDLVQKYKSAPQSNFFKKKNAMFSCVYNLCCLVNAKTEKPLVNFRFEGNPVKLTVKEDWRLEKEQDVSNNYFPKRAYTYNSARKNLALNSGLLVLAASIATFFI